jgi:tetratricopeptide (TPR) repeat protein
MSTNNVQELYDKALQYWQNEESEKAIELVEQALILAPENLDLHCLAMHVKNRGYKDYSFLPHAELSWITTSITMILLLKTRARLSIWQCTPIAVLPAKLLMEKRRTRTSMILPGVYHKYATKVLKAGYPVIFVDSYIDALVRLGLFDEAFTIGKVCLKLISGKEVGLPGLDKTDYDDYDSDEFIFSIIESLHEVLWPPGNWRKHVIFISRI